MSPAGRPLNSTSNTSLANRNHANPVNTQQGERRLRSNNSSSNSPLKPSPRKQSGTPNKSPGFKASASNKNNDLPQRILAILESVPSTISVSTHPSNSLPTNFSSLANKRSEERRHSHQEQSDEDFDPEEELSTTTRRGSVNRFSSPGANTASSFKRPAHHGLKRGLKKHGRKESRNNSLTSSAPINGMPPPSQSSSKLHSFRTRALDPLRQMPIRIIPSQSNSKKPEHSSGLEMLHNNTVIKRPMFNVSTGMEKEEEKEHHLKKAIEAQRAQTSGTAASSSHFIPIREVENVSTNEYKAYSNWKQIDKTNNYISYKKGKFDFFDDDFSYDADEEDLQFLQENNFFISLDHYENVIEKLEMASRERVPSLHEFHQQHPELVLEQLERVYDFWISRRMKLIRDYKTSIPLIPYVPSKNKLGEKDNPYVAFRHRGPKLTTRRKQKIDAEHYGTMLRLAAAIRRTHILTKAIVERDTLKLKMVETNAELFDEELSFLERGGSASELQSLYPTERQITTTVPHANKWLMKVWSEVAREIFNTKPLNREENILAIATRHGPEDGRFAFVRQPSCTYRTHHSSDPNHQESSASRSRALQAVKRKFTDNLLDNQYEKVPRQGDDTESNVDLLDGYRTRFVGLTEDTWEQLTGQRIPTFARSRFGRGGRVKLDFLYK